MKLPFPTPSFFDDNGRITNLTTSGTQSVAVIHSKAGAVRARHYHADCHDTYVVSGKVEYFERESPMSEPTRVVYGPGDFFRSAEFVTHAMRFLEDSVIITLATGVRDHENHEKSVHRVEWELPPLA